MRAQRLEVANSNLLILAETNLEIIEEQIKKIEPAFMIIDSVQTIYAWITSAQET